MIRFGDNTQTVLKMLDVCAFFESFQNTSSCEMRLAFWATAAICRVGPKKWPASVDLQAFKNLKVYKSNNSNFILAR
jgi:hypothetical protein